MAHPNEIDIHPAYRRMMVAANTPPLDMVQVTEVARHLTAYGIEVSPQQMGNWKTRGIPGKMIVSVASALGLNPRWLESGDGEMRPPNAMVMRLTHVEKMLDGHMNTEPGPDIRGKVPLISWVQAGSWHEASDPYIPGDADEWLDYPRKNAGRIYALRVRGDSMTASHGRSYPDGCVIFVDPDKRNPENGDRVIAKFDGVAEVTFKVFVRDAGKVWLKPLNPSHPIITDPFRVIGTVVGTWIDE